MRGTKSITLQLACILIITHWSMLAQKPNQAAGQAAGQGGQSAQSSQAGGAGGSQGLTGLTYTPAEWPELRLPDVKGPAFSFGEGRLVVCYRLEKGNSGTQPFVLEPVAKGEVQGTGFYRPCGDPNNGETDSEGQRICKKKESTASAQQKDSQYWSPCSETQNLKSPMLMNQILVVGIDISDLGDLGVNVDQLKLLNINVTNQQGSAINPSPIRPSFPGTASAGGGSGSGGSPGRAEDTSGEGSWWIPMGTHVPVGAFPEKWLPDQPYAPGAIVTDASGRQFYTANSGIKKSGFNSGPVPDDPFPPHTRVESVLDGNVIWRSVDGTSVVRHNAKPWNKFTSQTKNAIVCVARMPNGAGTGLVPVGVIGFRQPGDATAKVELLPGSNLIASSQPLAGLVQTQVNTSIDDSSLVMVPHTCDELVENATVSAYERTLKLNLKKADLPSRERDDDIKTLNEIEQSLESAGLDDAFELVKRLIKNDERKIAILQYYWTSNGGTSGSKPLDPLSIILVQRTIYLTWPYQLPGDVIPTFNVNLVYTPPAPGAIWEANTFYPAGSVVIPRTNNGRYYTALSGGVSGSGANEPTFPVDTPPKIHDGTLTWLDSGPAAPTVPASPGGGNQSAGSGGGGAQGGGAQGGGGGAASGATKPQLRFPNTHYLLGDVITVPETGHYYTAVESDAGFSGPQPQAQPAIPGGSSGTSDPFPKSPGQAQTLTDGDIQWALENSPLPVPAPGVWQAGNSYTKGQHMVAANRGYYVMIASSVTFANSGNSMQWPANPQPSLIRQDGNIEWIYDSAGSAIRDWQSGYKYSVGETVLDGHNHVYRMIDVRAGKSGTVDPSIGNGTSQPATVTDGDLLWADLGIGPAGGATQPWQPLFPYAVGQTARSLVNGHDYQVIRFIGGLSGPQKNLSFSILQSDAVVDPKTEIQDGGLSWLDSGQICPLSHPYQPTLCNTGVPQLVWRPNTNFSDGAFIFVPGVGNGRYYQAKVQAGSTSGPTSPFLNLMPPFPITWQNAGTTAPQSVASGQPADQTVSLINLTLPQTHSLSYFNIAAGVIVDFKSPPVFGWVPASGFTGLPSNFTPAGPTSTTSATVSYSVDPKTGCTISPIPPTPPSTTPTGNYYAYECPAQVSTGPKPVDPVLVLTGYFPPVDAEVPWRIASRNWWRDVLPGPSIGISLSSPASNFYLGLSNEFLVRNLQLFYGAAFHNVPTRLAPGSTQPLWGGTGTVPTVGTISRLQKGFFFGATFNLSGFVQSLFGGGGSKAP